MKLSQLKPGERARIKEFQSPDLELKLMEMGCIPGEEIIVEQKAPLGDPISVRVAGYSLSLRINEANQIIKYNPLLHWSTEQTKAYIDQYNVPYNILHDRGFISIGCAPCTRAIRAGEDFRAGRWWWEDQSKKECGLHVHQVVTN